MNDDDSLRSAASSWLNGVGLQDDPEWLLMAKLLLQSAESLDNNYQPSAAAEFRKLFATMTAYSEGSGSDALDKILKRQDG